MQCLKSNYIDLRRKCDHQRYCNETEDFLCDECKMVSEPYYTLDEFIRIVNNSDRLIHINGEYIDKNTPVEYQCDMCGCVSYGLPSDLLNGKCFCPKCIRTRGERLVAKWLIEHNIEYEEQKTFQNCSDKRALRFDFYLPTMNTIIEYDGVQHYKACSFGADEKKKYSKLRYTMKHDRIKDEYCKENGIRMIRIKYDDDVCGMLNRSICYRIK